MGDGWRYWYDLFRGLPRQSWVHRRFGKAVRIAAHRRFSEDLLRRLLEFEDLGFGAEVFYVRVRPGLYVACFSNPKKPSAYALQKLPSDAALGLLQHLVKELGVAVVETPSETVPDFELLRSIIAREFNDPAGFR